MEIHLSDTLSKQDSLYGVVYEGKSYYIKNKVDWFKVSIKFSLDDKEFRKDLISYMENYFK